jgi:hypothetical protein
MQLDLWWILQNEHPAKASLGSSKLEAGSAQKSKYSY